MNFPFDVRRVLPSNITIISKETLNEQNLAELEEIIDKMGRYSAKVN